MKIYVVSRTDQVTYDEYDSFVCIAKNEAAARLTYPRGGVWWHEGKWMWNTVRGDEEVGSSSWVPADQTDKLAVELLGTALRRRRSGTIVASFNAG